MIDTHCHIYMEHFEEDLLQVLDRAAEAGVRRILMPAINFGSLPRMDQMAHEKIRFHKMAGIHPTEINEGVSTTESELSEYCSSADIVAVGETGLDYHWSRAYKQEQQESLKLHCRVAKSVGKPVVLHNRESTGDLLDIIEQEQDGSLTGVWHCFTGSADEGRRAMDLGLYLGIGGVFTFNNAGVDEAVARLPLKKMILETDAPYLSPEPKRGKRNEPAFVRYTAQRLAEVMNLSLNEVDRRTTENAMKLFKLQDGIYL
ncbi:TatD family hydrolase [Halalkalibaculum sp. DA3122]|uniref:TatD family hydrolase n=1 Tax=Halalkalibaculum sp. DA3122 TaxID=3373607 RepID=UPI0037542545